MAKGKGPKKARPEADGGEGDDGDDGLVIETDGGAPAIKDIGAIRKEVASMLGELGLSAAAGFDASGFDDRDFRPPLKKEARKEKTDGRTPGDKQRAADEPQKPGKAGKRGKPEPEPEDEPPQHQREGGKRKRDWNTGAGPAPEPLKPPRQVVKLHGLTVPVPEERREASGVWWQDAERLAALPQTGVKAKPRKNGEAAAAFADEPALRGEARSIVARVEAEAERSAGRNTAWLKLVRRSGTAQDRVAASVVQVQSNILGNLKALDHLLELMDPARGSGGKRGAGQALEALRELFGDWCGTRLLLPDRKLKSFDQQPLASLAGDSQEVRSQRLSYFFLEDALKTRYERFIAQLEACTRDQLDWLKERAVKACYEMLSKKPEARYRITKRRGDGMTAGNLIAERLLLNILINKLGDPNRKTASNSAFYLQRLLGDHPAMKGVVVRDVGHFAFRPRIGLRAQYTAVIFLTQITLSHKGKDPEVALAMVELYFDLFRVLLAAGPQAEGGAGDASFKGKGVQGGAKANRKGRHDTAGRLANKKRAAAAAAEEAGAERKAVSPSALSVDSRLLSALLTGINRAFPYVDPDKVDALVERVSPHVFRIAHAQSLHGAVQALTLLFQMMSARSASSDRFYRALYEVQLNPGLPRSASAAMFLSLLFKALKADVNLKRIAAMCKRSLQVALAAPAPFACGTILLVSELLKQQPALWTSVLQPEDGEEDEKFVDAPLPEDFEMDAPEEEEAQPARGSGRATASAAGGGKIGGVKKGKGDEREDVEEGNDDGGKMSARFRFGERSSDDDEDGGAGPRPGGGDGTIVNGRGRIASAGYDMHKREPQFSKAERSCWWELSALSRHMHPSPAAMARTLLAGANVVYAGDPLADFHLTTFLDRWLQKKITGPKTQSKMQRQGQEAADRAAPGSAEFASLMEADVDPSDVFFHRYFAAKEERQKLARAERKADRRKGAKKAEDGEDGDGDGDGDDEIDPDWARSAARGADQEGFESSDEEEEAALDAALAEAEAGLGDGALDGEDDIALLGARSHRAPKKPATAVSAAAADDFSGGEDGPSDDDEEFGSEDEEEEEEDDEEAGAKRRRGKGAGVSAFASAASFEDALTAGGLDETRARRLGLLAESRGRRGGAADDDDDDGGGDEDEEDDDDDGAAAALGLGGDSDEEEEEEEPAPRRGGKGARAATNALATKGEREPSGGGSLKQGKRAVAPPPSAVGGKAKSKGGGGKTGKQGGAGGAASRRIHPTAAVTSGGGGGGRKDSKKRDQGL